MSWFLRGILAVCLLGLFVVAAAPPGYASPREPRGIYAQVDLSDYLQTAGIPPEGDDPDMAGFYDSLLDNRAISGLTLQVHWDFAQPQPDKRNWEYIDLAFKRAAAHKGKTIQLIVTAGFNSPKWLWDPSQPTGLPSCDTLLTEISPKYTNCGTATFSYYAEKTDQTPNGVLLLPLPWNPTYFADWHDFLKKLKDKYGSNSTLVSLSIAGPTAASAEMIMPNNFNTCKNGLGKCRQPSKLQAEAMWNLLFQYTAPPPLTSFPTNSDAAFIDYWENAIYWYENMFRDITLIVTPGAGTGFPSFNSSYPFPPSAGDNLYSQICGYSDAGGSTYVTRNYATRSCDAAATILSYFLQTGGGPYGDAIAGQTSGFDASNPTILGPSGPEGKGGDIGLPGLQQIATLQATGFLPGPQLLVGAQFNHPFSGPTTEEEGCIPGPKDCPGLMPEQAAYNVLEQFFRGTPSAMPFGGPALEGTGGAPTPAYVNVSYQDVIYAQNPQHCAQLVIDYYYPAGVAFWITAQKLLDIASGELFGQSYPYPPPSKQGECPPG